MASHESLKEYDFLGEWDDDNSPIPEVAATVPVSDDPTLVILTFRYLIISTLLTCFTSIMAQYFYFRYNTFNVNVFVMILIALPIGKALEYILPSVEIGIRLNNRLYGFNLNPGPFNIKEHTAIIMTAVTAIDPAYSIDLLAIQRLYFGDQSKGIDGGIDMGWIGSLLLILTTQFLGFGLVGFFEKLLVEPSYCWWPVNLVTSNLLHTFHGSVTSRLTSSRMTMFKWVLLMAFIFQFLPGLFMPVLQSIAFVCLSSGGALGTLGNEFLHSSTLSPIDPRPFLSQIGSGLNGGGIGSLSFSWESVGSLAPLYTPFWAQLNYLFSNYAFTWVITPILFQYNFWDAQKFPVFSTDAFTVNGTYYNISAVVDNNFRLNVTDYNEYSPLRLSPFWALSYGCSFAAITSSIVHVIVYHGIEIGYNMKGSMEDIHTKMMRKYKSVPILWYILLLALSLGLGMFTVEHWHGALQLKFWGVLVASIIGLIMILPLGIIQAISNKKISLNVFMEVIYGFIDPGNTLGNATFKTFGYVTVSQSISFMSYLKLGYYMKIPPRTVFKCQIYGTILSAVVNLAVFNFLLQKNTDIWSGAHHENLVDSQWKSTSPRIFYTASLIWGAIGSERLLDSTSIYQPLIWFFVGGALVTLLFYLLFRLFPNLGFFEYVHWPIIFESAGSTADGDANALLSATIFAFTFQYLLRKFRRHWYDVFNYSISAALDTGTLIAAFCIYVFLKLPNIAEKYGYNPVNPDPFVEMKKRIAVLISGNGSNLQALIDATQSNAIDAKIELVISNSAKAYGLQRASNAGITTETMTLKSYKDMGKSRTEFDQDLALKLRSYFNGSPDIIVLAGFMHILSPEFLNVFPNIVINLHPALPGAFDGINAISRAYDAFKNGSIEGTGVMVHKVIPQVDKGECILVEKVPIYNSDSLSDLEDRIHKVEHRLIVEATKKVLEA